MDGFTQYQKVDLDKNNLILIRDQPIIKGDANALKWVVTVTKGGKTVDLTGATATLYCARAKSDDDEGGTTWSKATVASGGMITAVLPKDAANIPGTVGCAIRVTQGSYSVTVARMSVQAADPNGSDIVDEGKRIPNIDEVLAAVSRCESAAASAESATKSANTATTDANTAATNANSATKAAQAATTNANMATRAANAAAGKIDNMTVQVSGLEAGAAPTADLSLVDGHYNLSFAIPKGDKGDTGATGATPEITVKVVTGEAGTQASVAQSGTAENPVITLTIPRGDTGSLGGLTINGKAPDATGKVMLTAEDVGAASAAELSQLKSEIINYWETIYPVGAIYISIAAQSPAEIFGGTWEQVKDRFLLAAGDSYAAGSTGGHEHVRQASYLPPINSKASQTANNNYLTYVLDSMRNYLEPTSRNIYRITNILDVAGQVGTDAGYTEGTEASYLSYESINLPPYLSIYMWKRVS